LHHGSFHFKFEAAECYVGLQMMVLQASLPVTTPLYTESKLAEATANLRQSEQRRKVTANQN